MTLFGKTRLNENGVVPFFHFDALFFKRGECIGETNVVLSDTIHKFQNNDHYLYPFYVDC